MKRVSALFLFGFALMCAGHANAYFYHTIWRFGNDSATPAGTYLGTGDVSTSPGGGWQTSILGQGSGSDAGVWTLGAGGYIELTVPAFPAPYEYVVTEVEYLVTNGFPPFIPGNAAPTVALDQGAASLGAIDSYTDYTAGDPEGWYVQRDIWQVTTGGADLVLSLTSNNSVITYAGIAYDAFGTGVPTAAAAEGMPRFNYGKKQNLKVNATPEPGSALLALLLCSIALIRRRKRQG